MFELIEPQAWLCFLGDTVSSAKARPFWDPSTQFSAAEFKTYKTLMKTNPLHRTGEFLHQSLQHFTYVQSLFQELFQSSFGFSVFQRIVCSVFLTC